MNSLEKLEKKLSEYKRKHGEDKPAVKEKPEGNVFVIAELIAGIGIGGFLGYYLDQYFHTKVVFLLIFIILGLISSFYNIYNKFK